MRVAENISNIKESIPATVTLIAVSKKKSKSDILEAYNEGQRNFGENKVQELVQKALFLPVDIKWHMIGHLQKNKVKKIAPFVHLIHSVDSLKLLKEINKRAKENNRIIKCLLQVHIGEEVSKFGFQINQIEETIISSYEYVNIKITGLMGMATFTKNKHQIQKEFSGLRKLFNKLKSKQINTLSMGMSNDYKIAIKEGSNMIRLGSVIFGKRNE